MIVSNFELLVKRIAPRSGFPSVDAAFRRVVQGYFLEITNLDLTRGSSFFMRFTVPALPAGSPLLPINREMVVGPAPSATSNVVSIFDVAGSENQNRNLTANATLTTVDAKVFDSQSFFIGPRQTVSFTLLPNIGVNRGLIPSESMEVRGMVELIQAPPFFFLQRPAIDVLLTPEIRGTFLDNDYPTASTTNELDFDPINFGLPLASGKAQNTVEAADPFRLPFPPFLSASAAAGFKIPPEMMEQMNEELAAFNLVVKKKAA
jgi:hypothetical protein